MRLATPLFALGRVVATPGAFALATSSDANLAALHVLLSRHHAGDWGTVDASDWRANDAAVRDGDRLLSAYVLDGERVWIITEADRSATTVLLPEEY